MGGWQSKRIGTEDSKPRSASPLSQPPVFPGLHYARVDLDRYASEHSLTLALEPDKLIIRGDRPNVKLVVEDPNSPYFVIGKPVPYAETGTALLEDDTLPGKS